MFSDFFSQLIIASLLGTSSVASPASLEKRGPCDFSGATGAAAVKAQKGGCSVINLSNLAVPAGQTLDLSNLKTGTKVNFIGTSTFGFAVWEGEKTARQRLDERNRRSLGPLVRITGNGITVTGEPSSVLDELGPQYWDKGNGIGKPQFFAVHGLHGNSVVNSITLKNTPQSGFSISGSSDTTFPSCTVDHRAGAAMGHNTDGFDVDSSTNIKILGATVYNQDDCLAVNSGLIFDGGACYSGHGISIGSVGGHTQNVVSNIHITNSKIIDSDYGIRIKTVIGKTGAVKDVEFKGINMSNIRQVGIMIGQNYDGTSYRGAPTGGIPITSLSVQGISGSMGPTGVQTRTVCANCSGWTWGPFGLTGKKDLAGCVGVPPGASC
ncbi:putative glycosyl hydrolases family 28 protein 2 [Elsinoe fawcettii]|nr:putative glycosyl hydrolases family 28 protein 2 [Elsinoe fawcettii]